MTHLITSSVGSPFPLGCTFHPQDRSINFALFSSSAKNVTLGLFKPGAPRSNIPEYTIPLHQTDHYWHIALSSLPKGFLYGYQCDEGNWLLDPYAKIIDSSPIWYHSQKTPLLGSIETVPSFDWEGATHPNIAKEELIIYELHVRGFTIHPSSKTTAPGCYSAIIEKIPYLKKLGVNAIELMPIYEFNENNSPVFDPVTKERLPNYWGYDPLSYFSPKRSYATNHNHNLQEVHTEFKTLVKALHVNGIEVILDVVYNHTGKSSLRCIDKETYYILDATGQDRDYTGCGHTISANHPVVSELILESLRYWVTEFHIDGFRFDLASTLTRASDGRPLDPSPLLQAIQEDPLLSKRKLIAEAWDAVGLYQLGSFPKWGPWSEWNGRYRDIVRRFLKGTNDKAGLFANALTGSDFLYHSTTPLASVNFVTAHDGFCLRDLVTYQLKHNWPNGEMNRDGCNHNDSWNCGVEGLTRDPSIKGLREQQMRNFWLALFLSQGIPMMLMGDEYGHTRHGNNNPYVQDNEINWFLWYELEENEPMFQFVRNLIAFRKNHPELRQTHFLTPDTIDWHGCIPYQPDWSPTSRFVAFSLKTSTKKFYIAFNAHYNEANVQLPPGTSWQTIVDTQYTWDHQWFEKKGPVLGPHIVMPPHTALIACEQNLSGRGI